MTAPLILLTGKTGQVGAALVPILAEIGDVVALGRKDCDLADLESIRRTIRTLRPALIVNPAAYTAVDKAESDRASAHTINALAPESMAQAARDVSAALIHYSTDYVFDGRKATAYVEADETAPLSVYGQTKRDGEIAIRANLEEHFILRTSWVFSTAGSNFLKTMLRFARERDTLNVVSDQWGAPTSAGLLARVTGELAQTILHDKNNVAYGTYHLTALGETSWHGYASRVIEQARRKGMAVRVAQQDIKPVLASTFPTAATRPINSRLDTRKIRDTFGISLPPWQDDVQSAVEALA